MRIQGLDFLRGIAILGVLSRHSDMRNVIVAAGGYGVDLFFVLSGFLVAGLLFKAYQKSGSAGIGRFLIRRGFKIYPAFYIYLFLSVLIDTYFFHRHISANSIFTEALFLQSYGYPIRFHTWSLAVEEHFYILLSLLTFFAVRFGWLENKKAVVTFLISTILLVFTLRFIYCLPLIGHPHAFFATHLRIDGLFMGALLSYIWYFKPALITQFYKYKLFFCIVAFVLISPLFILAPGSFFMMTIGFNLMHIGFAFFILVLADKKNESFIFTTPYLKSITAAISFIGVSSYSIYLWHLLVKELVDTITTDQVINTLLFFTGAIAVGVLSTYLIERTFLNIRNRYFPGIA